jgi:hypothetical protein
MQLVRTSVLKGIWIRFNCVTLITLEFLAHVSRRHLFSSFVFILDIVRDKRRSFAILCAFLKEKKEKHSSNLISYQYVLLHSFTQNVKLSRL